MRSEIPPWPGMESPKSLILKARLKPDAKKPPNGAMTEANTENTMECITMGAIVTAVAARGSHRTLPRPLTKAGGRERGTRKFGQLVNDRHEHGGPLTRQRQEGGDRQLRLRAHEEVEL